MAKSPRTIWLVRQIQLTVYTEMLESLKEFDITPAQYMVLSLLSDERGQSAADLARRAQMTPQSMNELVAPLQRKGLIRRREHPANRRILCVFLTKAGTRFVAECSRQIDQMESKLFSSLSEKELMTYRALQSKLYQAARTRRAPDLETTSSRRSA